ncbi:MAG: long-chain fatty acid--CoA ligase [Bacteroidetes bacterium]|nr:MAG: long-chain fatty acid--CoA ligase [Bacteroidota bacterium]
MAAVIDFKTVSDLFTGLADRHAGTDRVIMRYRDKQSKEWCDITWDMFRSDVRAMAGFLLAKGVRPRDRVAILSENRPEWAVMDMATQILGAINVSLYTSLPPAQVEYILNDSGAKIFLVSTRIQYRKAVEIFGSCPALELVVTISEPKNDLPDRFVLYGDAIAEGRGAFPNHESEIQQLTNRVSPDDISALVYTSGTTGNPKGVMLSHENFCTNVKAALERIPFELDDRHISFLPLCHSLERTAGYTAVLAYGGTINYAESVDTVARDMMEIRPHVLLSVPRLYEKMFNAISKSFEEGSAIKRTICHWSIRSGKKYMDVVRSGKNPGVVLRTKYSLATRLVFSKLHEKLGGRVRVAASGGAALPAEIGEFFMAAGITIIEAYGLTETAPILTINPTDKPRFGTVGHVIGGVTIGIQDLESGEIIGQIRGEDYPTDLSTEAGEIVAKGPNIMLGYWNDDEATKEAITEDGWYHTGDVGRFDEGYLRITDRIKHMLVSAGGKNIYPGPIEDGLKTEPFIDQILVVGEGREYLTALIVPDEDVIRSFAKENQLPGTKLNEILRDEKIEAEVKGFLRAYSMKAAAHEKIRGFRFVPEPFSVENLMMSPKMSLKRRVIEKNYADLIEEMYEGVV